MNTKEGLALIVAGTAVIGPIVAGLIDGAAGTETPLALYAITGPTLVGVGAAYVINSGTRGSGSFDGSLIFGGIGASWGAGSYAVARFIGEKLLR